MTSPRSNSIRKQKSEQFFVDRCEKNQLLKISTKSFDKKMFFSQNGNLVFETFIAGSKQVQFDRYSFISVFNHLATLLLLDHL